MRRQNLKKVISIIVTLVLLFSMQVPAYTETSDAGTAPLVLQELNYTENPVDIPNPDRGFYRPQSYVVPVAAGSAPGFPNLSATISGTTVQVNSRIVYMEFDLRNFSSNAPLSRPIGPWTVEGSAPPDYGVTQPLTPAAIDYIRAALQRVRDSEAVAIVKFSYDGQGRTYIDATAPAGSPAAGTAFDRVIHDCEPGAAEGREWYESGTWTFANNRWTYTGGTRTEDDSCGIPGHEDKNWVQYHLWQIGSIFSEYEDCIMVVKGGIFGAWGEMHSSSYTRTADGYHWLINAYMDYLPESRSILAHAGGAMAWQNMEYGTNYSFRNLPPIPERGTRPQRIGMFNDSYSAGGTGTNPTDNGSLSEAQGLTGSGYNRNAALTWIRNQNNFYGGESVSPSGTAETNIYPYFPSVPYEAAYARTTHLNTSWNQNTYRLWGDFLYNEENVTKPFTHRHDGVTKTAIFDPVYDGRNGMEYMRDRLGYRLVLREAYASEWVNQNGTLTFEGKIQNVGFGNVVNKKNVAVILKAKDDSDGTYTVLTDIDPYDWQSDLDNRPTNTDAWRDLNFSIDMSEFGDVPLGDYDIYLKINDPKETSATRRCIQFANYDIWNAAIAANKIGSTTVAPIEVTSVKIDGAAIQQVRMRNTKQFTATVNPGDATDQSVTWESSNPKIFTVDEYGLVTGLSTGNAKLIVTSGGVTSFIMVQVTA